MKPTLLLAFLALGGTLGAQTVHAPSLQRRAWEQRSSLEEKNMLARGCTLPKGGAFTDGGVACQNWLIKERVNPSLTSEQNWHGFLASIHNFPHSENVVRVQISKTADTDAWVIRMIDPDGHIMSYWLDSGDSGGGNVEGIEPY